MKTMKRALAILLIGLMAVGSWPAVARADDTDIFTTASVKPNVLILFDNSGSMNDQIPRPPYDPNTDYVGNNLPRYAGYISDSRCGADNGKMFAADYRTSTRINTTFKNTLSSRGTGRGRVSGYCGNRRDTNVRIGNYMDYVVDTGGAVLPTKLRVAKDAVKQLIEDNWQSVRFGLELFNTDQGGRIDYAIQDMTSSTKDALKTRVEGILGETWTPLGESLQESAAYFNGGKGIYPASKAGPFVGAGGTADYGTGPIQVECQKNFVILITDGESTQDIDNRLTKQYDGNDFRKGIGDYDGDGTDTTLGSNGSTYLDDVAKFMNDFDFRTDLPGKQNVSTYTIGFTVNNTLLQNAATNGGGVYFTAENADELNDALKTALIDIVSRAASFTSLVVPAVQTSQDNVLYSASFTPTSARPFWKGSLKAYPLDSNGNPPTVEDPFTPGKFILDDAKKLWSAGDKMNSLTAPARNIYTVDASKNRIPFDSNIPSADLDVADPDKQPLIDYITGNHGALVDWVLGDIFHSTPAVVGTPPVSTSDVGFADFRKGLLSRDRMLIYGANDGMLHATYAGTATFSFNGNSYAPGDEVWAFIPREELKRLRLSDPNLTASATHQYYTDSTPRVADAYIDAYAEGAKRWRTLLMAGARKGGRFYLALDITDPVGTAVPNPAAYQYPKYLWSFMETEETGTASIVSGKYTNDIDKGWAGDRWKGFALIDSTGKRFLITNNNNREITVAGGTLPTAGPYVITEAGESWSEPVFGKVKVGGADKWVAFVAGGYDSTSDPTSTASGGDAYNSTSRIGAGVFVVDLDNGALLAEFTNKRFGGTLSEMKYAIPSAVTAVDTDNDGFIDRLYVGDLRGQMWRISYTGSDVTKDKNDIANWDGERIFDAKDDDARDPESNRPVFYPPTVAFDPAVAGKMWVFFGTGNQNTPQDTANPAQAAFFALTDPGTGSATLQWSLGNGSPDNTFAAGEKILAASSVFNNAVFFTTYTPTASSACGGGGNGKLYAVQYTNGYAALDFSNGYAALAPGPNTAARSTSIGSGIPSRPVFSLRPGSAGQKPQFELFISSSGRDLLLDPKAPGGGGGGAPGGIPRVPGPTGLKSVRYWREI